MTYWLVPLLPIAIVVFVALLGCRTTPEPPPESERIWPEGLG